MIYHKSVKRFGCRENDSLLLAESLCQEIGAQLIRGQNNVKAGAMLPWHGKRQLWLLEHQLALTRNGSDHHSERRHNAEWWRRHALEVHGAGVGKLQIGRAHV